ncbi:40-residue YVTN family beta-propeller repeat-containing protein [Pseudonocardia thermophila]|uniref:40-residue YVTN family beta-propeller repeat-containing protein n=1 Tax=Pseudonocardia thermophila TaxID=1848 RepID=A0A1M6ZF67_PSETH|nr:hypothetical protein [Pseudonocardia thermophila]SHL29014.1 40-residue YVTN family beta-propeller repeat-containing protein [Pseudonocardia thermophila]
MPHWAAITPDGRTAYTTDTQTPYVSVVDLTGCRPARKVPGPGSEDLALSPDGTRLYVATPAISLPPASPDTYAVQVVDVATNAIVHTVPVPGMPSPVHVTADGKLLVGQWRFSGAASGTRSAAGLLSIFDAAGYEPLAELEVGISPINITSTPDGATGFVTNLQSGTVSVIDLRSLEVAATLEVDPRDDSRPRAPLQGAHGVAYLPGA